MFPWLDMCTPVEHHGFRSYGIIASDMSTWGGHPGLEYSALLLTVRSIMFAPQVGLSVIC